MSGGKTDVNCLFFQIYRDVFVSNNDTLRSTSKILCNINVDKK